MSELPIDVRESGYLEGLIELAGETSGADRDAVRSLASLLLASPPGELPRRRGRSGLNNDSSPLEVCLSSLRNVRLTRLVADPAWAVTDPVARSRRSVEALEAALRVTGADALGPLCRQTLDAILPPDEVSLRRYVEGVLWLGAAIGLPGIALYVDATKETAPERLAAWLRQVLPPSSPAHAIVEHLLGNGLAVPMAAGLEGTSPENARAKLFWRLPRPMGLGESGIAAFEHESLTGFAAAVLGGRALPLPSLVLSASFFVAGGEPCDAKVDVCAHCLGLDLDSWESLLDWATAAHGLAPMRVREVLADGRAVPAFVGFNRNAAGQERLDLFLKPSAWYPEDDHV